MVALGDVEACAVHSAALAPHETPTAGQAVGPPPEEVPQTARRRRMQRDRQRPLVSAVADVTFRVRVENHTLPPACRDAIQLGHHSQ